MQVIVDLPEVQGWSREDVPVGSGFMPDYKVSFSANNELGRSTVIFSLRDFDVSLDERQKYGQDISVFTLPPCRFSVPDSTVLNSILQLQQASKVNFTYMGWCMLETTIFAPQSSARTRPARREAPRAPQTTAAIPFNPVGTSVIFSETGNFVQSIMNALMNTPAPSNYVAQRTRAQPSEQEKKRKRKQDDAMYNKLLFRLKKKRMSDNDNKSTSCTICLSPWEGIDNKTEKEEDPDPPVKRVIFSCGHDSVCADCTSRIYADAKNGQITCPICRSGIYQIEAEKCLMGCDNKPQVYFFPCNHRIYCMDHVKSFLTTCNAANLPMNCPICKITIKDVKVSQ